MAGKHGSTAKDTEVPRATLVDALEVNSDLKNTQDLKKSKGTSQIAEFML
jgi:hypothetical protein